MSNITIRLPHEGENIQDYVPFDNTKLVAINTCPTWGLVRYCEHKRMGNTARNLALEAGSACHEFFAAVRLLQLKYWQDLPEHFEYQGKRLFGETKFAIMKEHLLEGDPRKDISVGLRFCMEALYLSGYHDDPKDRYRTMANLEQSCMYYFDNWNFRSSEVWVSDKNDPSALVGIEIPIEMVAETHPDNMEIHCYRFTGKLDGLHQDKQGLFVYENKTASRLNDAWRMAFDMASQITGYCIAGSVLTKQPVLRGRVKGLAIPIPKSTIDGIATLNCTRTQHMLDEWGDWFIHTVNLYEMYKHSPTDAPKYTHSCSRYFSPCSLLALCTADKNERKMIMEEQMHYDEWSPLDNE